MKMFGRCQDESTQVFSTRMQPIAENGKKSHLVPCPVAKLPTMPFVEHISLIGIESTNHLDTELHIHVAIRTSRVSEELFGTNLTGRTWHD